MFLRAIYRLQRHVVWRLVIIGASAIWALIVAVAMTVLSA